MTNIIKPPDPTYSLVGGKLSSKASSFQDRVRANRAKEANTQEEAFAVPHRIQLSLDCSGSMHDEKMEMLRKAVELFVNRCNFADTAVGIHTFGSADDNTPLPLTRDAQQLHMKRQSLYASGSTPMLASLTRIIETPLTRAVVVSDGRATDWNSEVRSTPVIQRFVESHTPIDCVHIGDDHRGEERLREIARATGGLFLKFTDVGSFSTAFAYLTPGYRAMLTDGRVSLTQLGADEVRS